MRKMNYRVLPVMALISMFSLLISCPNIGGVDPGKENGSDGAGTVDEYFWGSWVRMDGGDEAWYFTDSRVTIGDSTLDAGASDESQIEIPGYTITKQTDNMVIVEPAGSLLYHLFRKSGATASVSGEILETGSESLSARGLGGIGGISVILENVQNEGNRIEIETDSDGNLLFDDIISGDTYTMTVPVQDNVEEPIEVDIIPSFDGQDIGNINLVEAAQNFKVSYSLGGGDEWGYYYADEYYDLALTIKNIGDADLTGGSYDITAPDGLNLSGGSLNSVIHSIPGNNGSMRLDFTVNVNSFLEDYRDFEIPVTIASSDGANRWSDIVCLRFFRETMTIHVRSDETENGFGVKGVVISPDNRSFPFATENRQGRIELPARESGYVLALSGADYTTETRYSLMINEAPPRDGSELRTASHNEPNNIEPMGTDAYLLHEYQGFLGVYDLDFYNIHNVENDIPYVTAQYHTVSSRPTWSWTVPGDSFGFRYRLNRDDEWTETYSTSYTVPIEQTPGYYTLEVQSRDSVGEWSDSGSCLVQFDYLHCVKADAGYLYSLFLTNDGSVYGCGETYYGNLGPQELDNVDIPVKLAEGMRDISVGAQTDFKGCSYMVTLDGRLMRLDGDSPDLEEIMSGVRSIEASTGVLYIITFDGTLYTAGGDNSSGILGNGTRTDSDVPVRIMEDVVKAQGGRYFSLALTTSGDLYGFGDLATVLYDQERLSPHLIMSDVKDFAAGNSHVLIVKDDGALLASGEGSEGQLGLGGDFYTEYTSIGEVSPGVKMVDAFGQVSMYVTEGNELYQMGKNNYGQVASGITRQYLPVKRSDDVISISAGWSHVFFMTGDNAAHGYGRNIDGELGRSSGDVVVFPD